MTTGARLRTIAALLSASVLSFAALAGTSSVEAAAVTIHITNGLDPASITVPRNTTVTFVNDDAERHRVRTTAAPTEFDSGNLETGQSYAVTLQTTGTYRYRDERNTDDSNYFGQITVSDSVTTATDPTSPTPPTTAAPMSVSVSIGDSVYVPSSITVAPGGTVTWTNNDDRAHTVTANDRSFDSGIMAAGATWSRTFPNGGTFAYFCELHPDMTGSVVVPASTGGGGGAEPPPPTTAAPTTTAPPSTTQPSPTAPGSGGGSTAPTSASVAITGNQFSPQTITIAAGGTVTWTNLDAVPHTATATNGLFNSGILRRGDRYSQTFTGVGTFDYFCELHPEMTARVVVVASGSSTPATTRPPAPTTTASPATATTTATTTPTASGGATASPTTSGSGTPLPTTGSVAIVDNQFSPQTITIAVGGTVSWVNQDAVPHTVTASDRSFDSGIMMRGDQWSRTFDTAGTYTYFCEVHPSMTATIVVTTPGSSQPPVRTAGGSAIDSGGSEISSGSSAGGSPGSTGSTGSTVSSVSAAPGSASVGMGGNQFQPSSVSIGSGGSVTWTNTDSIPHTVTADDGSFDSGIMMPGDTFTRTFTTPGEVGYRCTLHPGMTGIVEVLDAPADSGGGPGAATSSADGERLDPGDAAADAGGSNGAALTEQVIVSIEGDVFPAVTTVVAGRSVTWVNNDDVAHNVIAQDGSFASEKFMKPGSRFEQTFTKPGIYPYSCDLHPHMRGIIVVVPADEAADAAATPTVTVTDVGFEPPDLVVHQGDAVRWVFEGVLPHTVTADDGSFDSGILEPGDTFTFTFDELGTFRYTCILHPAMIGSITVVPADEAIPIGASGISTLSNGIGGAPAADAPPSSSDSSSVPMLVMGLLAGLAISLVVGIGMSISRNGSRSTVAAA